MLRTAIEIVWPCLEGKAPKYNNFLDSETEIDEGYLDTSVDFAKYMYEDQKARISTIESKSSIYLGFFGTVVAILSFALKDILLAEQRELAHGLILLFGGMLIIYILQVMRYSIKALERKGYHSIDESDFLHGNKEVTIISVINKVKSNYDVINEKVDYMVMAHEFTKRILGVLFITAISFIYLSIYKYIPAASELIINNRSFEFRIEWSDWILLLLVIVVISNSIQIWNLRKEK